MKFMKECLYTLVYISIVATSSASATAEPDRFNAAQQLTYAPETRSAGIDSLQQLMREWGDQDFLRLPLARALTWSGRLKEALEHYDLLVATCTGDTCADLEAEHGRVLLWSGQLEAAQRVFERILERAPDHVEAHVGLAQRQRWGARPLAALQHARSAVAIDPRSAEARRELAAAHEVMGLAWSARRELLKLEELQAGALEGAAPMRARTAFSPLLSRDSFGINRFTQRLLLETALPHDVRWSFAFGSEHLNQEDAGIQSWMTGSKLVWAFPRFTIAGTMALHVYEIANMVDAEVELVLRPLDGFKAAFRSRHRPFLDVAGPLDVDERAFYVAGSAGAQDIRGLENLAVDEIGMELQLSPSGWLYTYAQGRWLHIQDGNEGWSVASGFGLQPIRLLGRSSPLEVFLQFGSYMAGYGIPSAAYFSPSYFDAESGGLSLVVPIGQGVRFRTDGGVSFRIDTSTVGWYGGGSVELHSGIWRTSLRFERRDDLYFQWDRWWFSLQRTL
jgi:tetratricopeptide (TPR) repeat protein